MPVFHRVLSGVLVVTVDGDFTAQEVVRVGEAGLKTEELIVPAFVLLDLSGTAGMGEGRLAAVADFFAGPQTPVARLAVQAAANVADAIVTAATASGLEAAAFKTKADAMDWLLGG